MTTTTTGVARPAPTTLIDLLVAPAGGLRGALRAALLVVAGAALTALAAQVAWTAPWSPVPYTGQTAAVLLVGVGLGGPLGAASMLLYVAAGALGAPVFADGASGLATADGIRVSLGYLAGFVVAAALVGRLAQRGWDRSVPRAATLMVAGNLVIYAIGVPLLAAISGMAIADALFFGAAVFVPWDLLKIAVAAIALPAAWRLAGRARG